MRPSRTLRLYWRLMDWGKRRRRKRASVDIFLTIRGALRPCGAQWSLKWVILNGLPTYLAGLEEGLTGFRSSGNPMARLSLSSVKLNQFASWHDNSVSPSRCCKALSWEWWQRCGAGCDRQGNGKSTCWRVSIRKPPVMQDKVHATICNQPTYCRIPVSVPRHVTSG